MQLWGQGSTELHAQEWQQAGVSASAHTVGEDFWRMAGCLEEADSLQDKHQVQADVVHKVQGLDCWGLATVFDQSPVYVWAVGSLSHE